MKFTQDEDIQRKGEFLGQQQYRATDATDI